MTCVRQSEPCQIDINENSVSAMVQLYAPTLRLTTIGVVGWPWSVLFSLYILCGDYHHHHLSVTERSVTQCIKLHVQ